MNKILFSFIFLILFSKTVYSQTFQNIDIPCEVKECKTEWGPTNTRWYKGDGNKKGLQLFGMVVVRVIM